jgi:hypothetical protein
MSNNDGYDYTKAKAFIKDGVVNINQDRASISDVVHEYGHLFLHALKYESIEMYDNLISLAVNHDRFDEIADTYNNLNASDLNEEVFVTLFGEGMRNNLTTPKVDKVAFAKSQIESGAITWNGDKMSPRPVLGLEWSDIRKGQADILADKKSAAATKLANAIDKARIAGEYEFVQGSGKITETTFVPIEDTNPPLNEANKELMLNFADFTKEKLAQVLNMEVGSITDLTAKQVANLSLEEAIDLMGDAVMKNRIQNIFDNPTGFAREIKKLKDDLFEIGLLTEQCSG